MASLATSIRRTAPIFRPLNRHLRLSRLQSQPALESSPQPSWQIRQRPYSESAANVLETPEFLDEGERKVFDIIKDGLQPTKLEVQDVSGGCGSMYALDIVSDQFKGLSIIKQHRLVNKVLGDEMKKWHGVQLKTKAP